MMHMDRFYFDYDHSPVLDLSIKKPKVIVEQEHEIVLPMDIGEVEETNSNPSDGTRSESAEQESLSEKESTGRTYKKNLLKRYCKFKTKTIQLHIHKVNGENFTN